MGGLQKAARVICGGARRKRGRLFVGAYCGSFKALRRLFAAVAGANKPKAGGQELKKRGFCGLCVGFCGHGGSVAAVYQRRGAKP